MQSLRDSFNKDRLRLSFLLDLFCLVLIWTWNKTCVVFVLTSSKTSYTYIHRQLYLWRQNPILLTSCAKVFLGNKFVKRCASFSHEWTCWTFISPFFWRSWVKKNFGRICFVLSPLMYLSFNWATLSSYMIVGAIFPKDKPQVSRTCWITDLNQTHSQLASCKAKIYAWLVDVAVIVCFIDCHGIVVPPHVNKYHVCNIPLWGFDK